MTQSQIEKRSEWEVYFVRFLLYFSTSSSYERDSRLGLPPDRRIINFGSAKAHVVVLVEIIRCCRFCAIDHLSAGCKKKRSSEMLLQNTVQCWKVFSDSERICSLFQLAGMVRIWIHMFLQKLFLPDRIAICCERFYHPCDRIWWLFFRRVYERLHHCIRVHCDSIPVLML